MTQLFGNQLLIRFFQFSISMKIYEIEVYAMFKLENIYEIEVYAMFKLENIYEIEVYAMFKLENII